ncbi:hypothetical protein [Kineosporia succinea]|uniref:Uncharacterized protein n=1 Tax=Kineosporia succinea TaxID=84632 RepID=A0ABT9P1H9_9ACTN|nr:hypothetical protein [Kineosporia succinea]MDP9826538.1 hypothetical protein [Kineosporia succinea]
MADTYVTCHAIGRAQYWLTAPSYVADTDRLTQLRAILDDLCHALNLPDTNERTTKPMDGSGN